MSLEQFKAFLWKVKGDSSLQEKLKAAKSPEDVVGIAKEHGHDWSYIRALYRKSRDNIHSLSKSDVEHLLYYLNADGINDVRVLNQF